MQRQRPIRSLLGKKNRVKKKESELLTKVGKEEKEEIKKERKDKQNNDNNKFKKRKALSGVHF